MPAILWMLHGLVVMWLAIGSEFPGSNPGNSRFFFFFLILHLCFARLRYSGEDWQDRGLTSIFWSKVSTGLSYWVVRNGEIISEVSKVFSGLCTCLQIPLIIISTSCLTMSKISSVLLSLQKEYSLKMCKKWNEKRKWKKK